MWPLDLAIDEGRQKEVREGAPFCGDTQWQPALLPGGQVPELWPHIGGLDSDTMTPSRVLRPDSAPTRLQLAFLS